MPVNNAAIEHDGADIAEMAISFLSGVSPEVELGDHVAVLQLPTVAVPVHEGSLSLRPHRR